MFLYVNRFTDKKTNTEVMRCGCPGDILHAIYYSPAQVAQKQSEGKLPADDSFGGGAPAGDEDWNTIVNAGGCRDLAGFQNVEI